MGVLILCLQPHTTNCHRTPTTWLSFRRAWMRCMTMTNITEDSAQWVWRSSIGSSSFDSMSFSTRTGLKFIPLYSPGAPRCWFKVPTSVNSHVDDSDTHLPALWIKNNYFRANMTKAMICTMISVTIFGWNLILIYGQIPLLQLPTTDSDPLELALSDSCNDSSVPSQHTDDSSSDEVWLNQTSEEGDCVRELQQATVLSKCLSYHKPNIQIPEQKAKKAGCVLTSQENFQTLEKRDEKEGRGTEEARKSRGWRQGRKEHDY